jgi:hypothetical protein
MSAALTHQQQQHHRTARSNPTDDYSDDEEAGGGEVTIELFGGTHDQLNHPRLTRQSSFQSNSSYTTTSPATLTSSLFPSHVDGVFPDSLIMSEAPSLYASMIEVPETSSEFDDVISIPYSDLSSDRQLSENSAGTTSSGMIIVSQRRRSRRSRRSVRSSMDGSFSELSRPRYSDEEEMGGSFALTAGALAKANGVDEAVFTSDSSEDESLALSMRRKPRGLGESARYDEQIDSDEELLSRTPKNAGFQSMYTAERNRRSLNSTKNEGDKARQTSESSKDSYPTPPPESRRSRAVKRRHRTSGRLDGSQKKSSASGSVGVGEEQRELNRNEPFLESPNQLGDVAMREQREWTSRRQAEKSVFLGNIIGRITDITTLQLIAETPLSRSTTPTPISSSYRHTRASTYSQSAVVHGFDAFGRQAREDLGTGDFHFRNLDAEMSDLDEGDETGDETETEGMGSRMKKVFGESARSLSLSSLPLYLLGALPPLTSLSPPSSNSGSAIEADRTRSPRRTSSFSFYPPQMGQSSRRYVVSSVLSATSLCLPTAIYYHSRGSTSDEEVYEGDGLQAAIGYWRRVLRRLSGY